MTKRDRREEWRKADSQIHSRVGHRRQGTSRDEGAGAYTIWNTWIVSRGFNPPPGPRSCPVKAVVGKIGHDLLDSDNQYGRATAGQATAGRATGRASNVGNANANRQQGTRNSKRSKGSGKAPVKTGRELRMKES